MNNNLYTEYSGADTVKKKSKGAIIGIGALVLVGVATLSYLFVPQVKNTVRLATLEPNEYLQTISKDNFSNVSSAIAKQYDSQNDIYNVEDGIAYDCSVIVNLSDQMADNFGSMLLEDGQTLPSSFVKDYTFNGNFNAKDNLSKANVTLLAGDSTLLTTNLISDSNEQKVYLQVPELSSSYLYMTPSRDDDYYSYNLYDSYMEQLQRFNVSDIQENVSSKDIEDTINKYTDIIVDNLTSDTTLEKNVTGDVLSVEYKYNKLSTMITSSQFVDISNQIVTELQSDEIVKTIVVDSGYLTTDEYSEKLSAFQEDINSIDTTSQETITLDTYVNSMGIICGIGLGNDYEYYSVMFANDSTEYALQFYIDDYDDISTFDIYANEVQKNTFTGNASITTDSETFTINFSDLNVDNDTSSGTFTMDLSSFDVDNISTVTVDFATDTQSQSMNLNFSDLITVQVMSQMQSYSDISVPTGDMFDYNTQYYDYFQTIDSENLLVDILTKVGLYDWYQEQMSTYYGYDYSDMV